MNRSVTRPLAAAAATAVLLAVPAGAGAAAPKEPKAPASAEQITAYYDGGGYARDLKRAVTRARAALKRGLKTVPRGRKPAMVLDIDDTSLSTYACQKAAPGGFSPASVAGCVLGGQMPAITPIRALARDAQRRKVRLAFITGRPDGIRAITERNLRNAGYRNWVALVMKPSSVTGSLVPYKSGARKALERQGYRIILNVGDQRSDLSGGAARAAVKLPNPMYFTP
jgi:predicted secreted acid phosphatase